MADGEGSIFAKLKAFAVRDWLLILLGGAALVVAWLIYRNQAQQANPLGDTSTGTGTDTTAGFVPSGGSGQPIWPTSTGGTPNDFLQNLEQYIANAQTPNPPATATPTVAGNAANSYTSIGKYRLDQIALSYRVPGGVSALEALNPLLKGKNNAYVPPSGAVLVLPSGSSALPQGGSPAVTPHGLNATDPVGFM